MNYLPSELEYFWKLELGEPMKSIFMLIGLLSTSIVFGNDASIPLIMVDDLKMSVEKGDEERPNDIYKIEFTGDEAKAFSRALPITEGVSLIMDDTWDVLQEYKGNRNLTFMSDGAEFSISCVGEGSVYSPNEGPEKCTFVFQVVENAKNFIYGDYYTPGVIDRYKQKIAELEAELEVLKKDDKE